MNNEQECSYSSAKNNNIAQGHLWNHSTTLGTPSGMHLIEVDRNQAHSGTPHGMSQSEHAPSGNNLTSVDNPSRVNLLNGLTVLGNPASTKQSTIAKERTQSNTHYL